MKVHLEIGYNSDVQSQAGKVRCWGKGEAIGVPWPGPYPGTAKAPEKGIVRLPDFKVLIHGWNTRNLFTILIF